MREPPSGDLRAVDPVLIRVSPGLDLLITEFFFRVPPDVLQLGYAIDGVDGQAEAIDLVVYRQFHRSVDVALLLVAANMDIFVPAGVSQAVNQVGISVEIEDDRLVYRKQGIEVAIR